MTKQDAIKIFGQSGQQLGDAIGISRQGVSKLPDELPEKYVDRVIGAAIRLGKPLPKKYRERLAS